MPLVLSPWPNTPVAKASVLEVLPQMPMTPVLSTSNVACGAVVRTPTLSPDWNIAESPNVLLLLQIGMKCGAPCPRTADVLVVGAGAVFLVVVEVWAETRATERVDRIKTIRILDFIRPPATDRPTGL